MSKLSLDALKERAEATASTELMAAISGGLENACHDGGSTTTTTPSTTTSSDFELSAGASIPVGGQPTFTIGIKWKF